MKAREKIKELMELRSLCDAHRDRGNRIVFTNGCFDLLHVGHIRYLEAARELGDLLIVGVNSDESVKEIKGPLRPVTDQRERSELVAALQCVDFVAVFDTPDPLPIIEILRPHILVKGADWAKENIVGADIVETGGGRVVRIPLIPETSTTGIIEKIVSRFGQEKHGQS